MLANFQRGQALNQGYALCSLFAGVRRASKENKTLKNVSQQNQISIQDGGQENLPRRKSSMSRGEMLKGKKGT